MNDLILVVHSHQQQDYLTLLDLSADRTALGLLLEGLDRVSFEEFFSAAEGTSKPFVYA